MAGVWFSLSFDQIKQPGTTLGKVCSITRSHVSFKGGSVLKLWQGVFSFLVPCPGPTLKKNEYHHRVGVPNHL